MPVSRVSSSVTLKMSNLVDSSQSSNGLSRRSLLSNVPMIAAVALSTTISGFPQVSNAISDGKKFNGAEDGNLPDLPKEAARSYLQYRFTLQLACDYYLFELQPKLGNIDDCTCVSRNVFYCGY